MSRLDDLTDRLNPLLVKEARQIFKSRFFAASFLIVLGVGWFVAFNFERFGSAATGDPVGARLYFAFYLLLSAALCVPVPLAAMYSLAFEHRDQALEMLQIAPLSAEQIVNGKLQAAVLHAGLYLSALVPFMCFAYLLGGIGLIHVVGLALEVALLATALVMFALLMGILSRTPARQSLATLGLLVGMAATFGVCAVIGETANLAMAVCCLVPAMMVFAVCREFTMLYTRQVRSKPRTLFIDLRRIQVLIPLAREVAGLIRQHFPSASAPVPPMTHVPFRVIHRQTMERFRKLNAQMCRSIDLKERWNFVSYDLTEPPLRQVRLMLDRMLATYRWSVADVVLVPFEQDFIVFGRQSFPVIEPEVLDRLEAAASDLERACAALQSDSSAAENLPESRLKLVRF